MTSVMRREFPDMSHHNRPERNIASLLEHGEPSPMVPADLVISPPASIRKKDIRTDLGQVLWRKSWVLGSSG